MPVRATYSAALILCAATMLPGADKPKLPEGPGKVTTEKLCGTCHGAEVVMSKRESRDGWNGIVDDMIQRGAKGTDDELGEVVDYLTATFSRSRPLPKVSVNKATDKELIAGLGVTDQQAGAIVRYREQNGNYKSIDDLKKVPGIQPGVIEAKKNRLDFEL